MSNTFTFNNINSSQFHMYCSNGGTYDAPERDVKSVAVPGRNGELTIDNGRFTNAKVLFPCFVAKNFAENAEKIREWLLAPVGYCRLQDDAHPDEFRMARFVGGVEFEPNYTDKKATVDLTFSCMPQRFLTSGENVLSYTRSDGSIEENPTPFEAKPLLTAYGSGSGSVVIAGETIRISNINGSVTIDCDTMNAYNGAENRNGTITVSGWPVLPPGQANYSFSGGVTSIDIIPRWWTV